MEYKQQLTTKKQLVIDALTRIGRLTFPPPTLHPAPQEWEYRKHLRLTLVPQGTGFMAGYVPRVYGPPFTVQACPLAPFPDSFFTRLQEGCAALEASGITNASCRLFVTDERPVIAFSTTPRLPRNHKAWASQFAHLFAAILFKSPRGSATYGTPPPGTNPYGFTQCHPAITEKLYTHITQTIGSAVRILDLYGGSGDLACQLAAAGKEVTLVEKNPASCQEAQQQAALHDIPLTIHVGDAASFPAGAYEVALVNPPRDGLEADVRERIIQTELHHLIYTSCMPATLARDCAFFAEHGFEIVSVDAFDMFPQTTHIETVVFLRKTGIKKGTANG